MRALLLCLACLAPGVAAAAPILLVEFAFEQPEPVTLPATYKFWAEDTSDRLPRFFRWDTVFSELGTEQAEPAEVSEFNRYYTFENRPGQRLWLVNGGQQMGTFGSRPIDGAWLFNGITIDGYTASSFVPQLNHGLFGYFITSVERIVTAEAQTVRFYGIVSPEPSAWLLMLLGVGLHLSRRCRASR